MPHPPPYIDHSRSGPATQNVTAYIARIPSVDLLRGLVIVLMALDHARDFFSPSPFDPTDLQNAPTPLFLTRWITHFCAPVFVFLAGASAALAASRGKTTRSLSRSLLIRGLWLILLEFTVIRLAWFLGFAADPTFRFAFVQVIWVLGLSMITLAALVHLPRPIILALSLLLVLGHNALDHIDPASLGPASALWKLLHVSTTITWAQTHTLFVRYPLLPWPGVMALGYLFAPTLSLPQRTRTRRCLLLGLALTLAFLLLRALNTYTDPHPWSAQPTPLRTALSFINTEKYPPSLAFLLMTLGPAIASLPLLERLPHLARTALTTFGRVPMFFYITHLYLLQLGAITISLARYGPSITNWTQLPPDYSLGLPAAYTAWLTAVAALYLPCRRYAQYRQRRRPPPASPPAPPPSGRGLGGGRPKEITPNPHPTPSPL